MSGTKDKMSLNSASASCSSPRLISAAILFFFLMFFSPENFLYAADNKKIAPNNQSPSSTFRGFGLYDDEAKRFIADWLRLSEDDEKLEALLLLYAEKVVYYKNKNADQSVIREDKEKYYNRWPQRRYTLKSAEVLADTDYYAKAVIVSYHFELNNKGKTLHGDAESFLWLDKKNNRIYIICETGHVISTGDSKAISGEKRGLKDQERMSATKGPRSIIIDSQTGYTVYPEEIKIKDPISHRIIYRKIFSKEEAFEKFKDGVISLAYLESVPLPPDTYECTVETANYLPMTSFCNIGKKSELIMPQASSREEGGRYEFHIDPIEKPLELKYEYLKSLERKESSLIVGFIVDDETGLPIANATIRSTDGGSSTKSNERGFFIIRFPFPGEYQEFPTTDISFDKEGYQTEERHYVELMPHSGGIYRIRLVPGKGKKIIDERKFKR